ncbi:MAG: EAL domain-containing protein, partial [Allorhizobium sp.]
ERMLERISAACIEWQREGLQFSRVGLNLSAADFHRGRLTQRIVDAVSRVGLPASVIVAEVTESVYLAQKDNVIAEEIRAMREAGIKVAHDEFGPGLESLTHLLTVPVDVIKIDKCFVRRLADAGSGSVITKGLLDIARGLGIWVIAEGIEEEAQAEHLLSLDCKAGQGYYFSRPMDRDSVREMLEVSQFHPDWSRILLGRERQLVPRAG